MLFVLFFSNANNSSLLLWKPFPFVIYFREETNRQYININVNNAQLMNVCFCITVPIVRIFPFFKRRIFLIFMFWLWKIMIIMNSTFVRLRGRQDLIFSGNFRPRKSCKIWENCVTITPSYSKIYYQITSRHISWHTIATLRWENTWIIFLDYQSFNCVI